jgi:hypothetical protein
MIFVHNICMEKKSNLNYKAIIEILYTQTTNYTHIQVHTWTLVFHCVVVELCKIWLVTLSFPLCISLATIHLVLKIVTSWDSHHKYNNHISQGPPIVNSSMYYVPWNQCVSLLLCHLAHVLCKVQVTERKEQASFQT